MAPPESSLLEARAPDHAPPPKGTLGLVLIACGLVAVAAMASVAWWSADLGGNLSSAVMVLGVTIAACVSAVVALRLMYPGRKSQRQLVTVVIIGVGLLLSAGAWYGTFLTVKMKTYEPA